MTPTAHIDPSLWTAVIPAAGRGSRLGFHRPKILFPVAGRPILDWLLDILLPGCASVVFVLSPDGAAEVQGELERRIPGRYDIVIQEVPTGMGDAVALALPAVRTLHTAIVWGDQVALRRQSVEACQLLHEGADAPLLTLPTVMRPNPYIHFDRDQSGRISGLRQAREGDAMPETGESDTGFFCFRTSSLRALLEQLRTSTPGTGHRTGEFNFLPVIPLAARSGIVLTPPVVAIEETVGINSVGDVAAVEEFLERSNAREKSYDHS